MLPFWLKALYGAVVLACGSFQPFGLAYTVLGTTTMAEQSLPLLGELEGGVVLEAEVG
jgi:hypothetical protein